MTTPSLVYSLSNSSLLTLCAHAHANIREQVYLVIALIVLVGIDWGLRRYLALIFILLFSSSLSNLFVRSAHSTTIIYINADGSISPSTAPITSNDNVTYSCIGDMLDSGIQILRNNTILNGNNHALQGSVNLDNRTGVTIEALNVTGSVSANNCTNTTIKQLMMSAPNYSVDSFIYSSGSNNKITDNYVDVGGIMVSNSFRAVVSRNRVAGIDQFAGPEIGSPPRGHGLGFSNVQDSVIEENAVWGCYDGLRLECSNCTVQLNNVSSCRYGMDGSGDGNIVGKNRLWDINTPIGDSSHLVYDSFALYWSGTNNTISGNIVEDSMYEGIVINLQNSTITGNIERNCAIGITVWGHGDTVFNNTITDNVASYARNIGDDQLVARAGGLILGGTSMAFSNNTMNGNEAGLVLIGANMTLRNNAMNQNGAGFSTSIAGEVSNFVNDVDTSNKIDGKPIYYLVNKHNLVVPTNAGYLALINCSNMLVQNLTLMNNGQGMLLAFTRNSTIINNNMTANQQGILLYDCPQTTIKYNSIARNNPQFDMELEYSPNCSIYGNYIASSNNGAIISNSNNTKVIDNTFWYNYWGSNLNLNSSSFCTIYHNNFIQQPGQAQAVVTSSSNNTFDDGSPSGGNYWSDYTGVDTRNTGLGFPYYTISGQTEDVYPLMGQIHTYNITVSQNNTQVDVESNSTISGFECVEPARVISFNVEGQENTSGFCRITVAKFVYQSLWQSNVSILINGTKVQYSNFTDSQNVYLYFTYKQSAHNIIIVPEYPLPIPTVLFAILLLAITVAFKIKRRGLSGLQRTYSRNPSSFFIPQVHRE